MPTTLIAWELGGGLGHVGPLRPVIDELARRGHTVRIATANVPLCRQALAGTGAVTLPCPPLTPSAKRLKIPCTFSDVLHDAGYSSSEGVTEAVGEWLRLIDAVAPDRLLADYSPTAMLAARVRGLPTTVIGTGFLCPPDVSPLPSLHPEILEPHWAEEVESTVLASMNAALVSHGGATLPHVAALYSQAESRLLLTLPELDHFPDRPQAPGQRYVRLFDSLPGAEAAWPEDAWGPRVFVYLREGSICEPLLRGLAMKGVTTIAFAPRLVPACAESLRGSSVAVHSTPVDLQPLLADCDAAVHHGGHITACGLLLAGVPTVTLPLSTEQSVTAQRLNELGVGLTAPLEDLGAIGGALEGLLATSRYAVKARRVAERYVAEDDTMGVCAVIEACGGPMG